MPGLVPPSIDERQLLLDYLEQQRQGIRYAAHGLSAEQVAARPSISELCLAGLIKHTALVEQAWVTFMVEGDSSIFMSEGDWGDGFRVAADETLDEILAFSSDIAAHTEKTVRELPGLDVALAPTKGGIPWIPEGLVWTPRWVLLHLIEEVARHAGHADIIRESIDGQKTMG